MGHAVGAVYVGDGDIAQNHGLAVGGDAGDGAVLLHAHALQLNVEHVNGGVVLVRVFSDRHCRVLIARREISFIPGLGILVYIISFFVISSSLLNFA